jgi:hypothetical protein
VAGSHLLVQEEELSPGFQSIAFPADTEHAAICDCLGRFMGGCQATLQLYCPGGAKESLKFPSFNTHENLVPNPK